MSRIFITGSADGLGMLTARLLIEQGHTVAIHARNELRAKDAARALPSAEAVLVGDLSSIVGMRQVAEQANATGRFDAVIHNVGVGFREARRIETEDGLAHVFAINVLAPYLLTALMERADRLVYLSSAMHFGGEPDLSDPQWKDRAWDGVQAYSDSKLYDVLLAFGVARRWPQVYSNAMTPGWVPTKMGGSGAPDDIRLAPVTQAWLAASSDDLTKVSGEYFYHMQGHKVAQAARDNKLQDDLLNYCASLSGVEISSK
ncbi:SDR family NAD(P)-dependent oxidoreductase [Caballeronia sp. LjRoot34]|uniref:SDR family NAD(P)-dependent oxidoreductase n=1 Tax=Caballeronia sp. LjRoot34 TaxID=3342325 RepID=UPI003ECD4FE5